MVSTRKFLYPVRQSLVAITSYSSFTSPPRQFLYTKCEPLKRLIKGFEPIVLRPSCVSGFRCVFNTQRKFFQNFYFSGSKIRFKSILAVSAVFGLMSFAPRVSYAFDEPDNLAYEHHRESWDASDVEDSNALWKFAKRFWLPLFFFLTVIAHLEDPITIIAFKVTLFLFSTKPSPFSVYVFVDELCNRYMRQEPHLYGVKSVYAHKVEVHDYKLLCLARVEVRDQKFSLVGILGGWWALPWPRILFKLAIMVGCRTNIIGWATEHPTPLREVHGDYWENTNNRHNDHQGNAVCLENLEFENSDSWVITAPPVPPVPVFADNF